MNLRKWCTNDPILMQCFNNDNEEMPIENTSNKIKKVLGIIWRPFTDELTVDLGATHSSDSSNVFTKRSVLQTIARIFDPMGLLGPFTVKSKIILQNIWKRKLDWDDVLPEDINKEWRKWQQGLLLLTEYSIKRCLVEKSTGEIELHIYADASPQAYGSVAYLKYLSTGACSFIVSKNRVAPINESNDNILTLPKLELTAALCSARLQKYLVENMSLTVREVVLWSDSKIAFYWIKGNETKWKPYVQNRVVEIRRLQNKESWRYCPGKQNPADLITRGVPSANHLIDSQVWLTGPPWLHQERENWSTSEFPDEKEINVITGFVEVQEKLTMTTNSIFNSRPLTYIDEDPSNLIILSPAMFLIGAKTLGFSMNVKIPKVERDDIIRAWQLRECIVSKFWKVWSQDYLQQLRSAHYGKHSKCSRFKVGDVVLLHDQHRPRLTWKMVRISNCFQGRDGRIRACEIQTSDGTRMRRPVQLLYPLEIEQFSPGEDVENST